jgi:hypothetical protein
MICISNTKGIYFSYLKFIIFIYRRLNVKCIWYWNRWATHKAGSSTDCISVRIYAFKVRISMTKCRCSLKIDKFGMKKAIPDFQQPQLSFITTSVFLQFLTINFMYFINYSKNKRLGKGRAFRTSAFYPTSKIMLLQSHKMKTVFPWNWDTEVSLRKQ